MDNASSSRTRVSQRLRTIQQNTNVDSEMGNIDPPLPASRCHNRRLSQITEAAPQPRKARAKRQKRTTTMEAAVNVGQAMPTTALALPLAQNCPKCSALKFAYESLGFCCSDGEVGVASNAYPSELIRLFTSQDADSLHFRTYARLYDNLFAFSSLGGIIKSDTKKGIYNFKLHGQIYHFIPDLLPSDQKPQFLQLYFYDAQHESENRLGLFPELSPDIISILMAIMDYNPYAKFFRSLKEIDVAEDTEIRLNRDPVLDQRVYNAPTAEEVAVIWSEESASSQNDGLHIVARGHSQHHRIMHYYGCYDPLQYPLLFPHGECGWHHGLEKMSKGGRKQVDNPTNPISASNIHDAADFLAEEAATAVKKKRGRISCREYYAYLLQIRQGNYLLKSCRLLQQFIVDMYVKLENTRLDFFRKNQAAIRAELYQGILDSFEGGETRACNVGHRVVLPPSFLGGPRDMKRRYLNAITLVQRYGKPDLFITMTCNPNWKEIKRELTPGEKAQNRPDLVARIFRAKLIALKKKIMEDHVLGEVAAFTYAVEFQKRGLPHAHMLLILKPENKLKDPAAFDKFVCAEIPSSNNPHLRKIILKHMMHGPCGKANPECACMKHKGTVGTCKYGYPRPFTQATTNHENGYPSYRRRDDGETTIIRKIPINNRWVIPHNPYLSALFDCHLNVEVCSTIQAVKYLYKYVYKGHDRVSFNVARSNDPRPVDEIEQFQTGRYVSPCEAAWRIFSFDLFEMYPPVLALQVHLPNSQTIQFRPHERLSGIVSDDTRLKTSLTEFFKMNAMFPNDPKYLYSEFPEHYVWTPASKAWTKRVQQKIVIGRMAFVTPAEGDRYFMRLLLAHVRGPESFQDLCTVNGHTCATFQEAALKLGLLEEDDAIVKCMEEAAAVEMPGALRRLFTTVLIFCKPSNPLVLWNKFYKALSEDFTRQHVQEPRVQQLTIRAIEQLLEDMGKSLQEFNLAGLKEPESEEIRRTKDIIDALDAPIPEEYKAARGLLNLKQRETFDCIIDHVRSNTPGAFFVDGPGGTGKTFLYCALYAEVRSMGKIVLPTATSGIAAANIVTGRTAHSRFKIPLDHTVSMACNVSRQSGLAALLREASLIIWDEASMARKENIESLNLLLRDLCNENLPFGGKVVVFGGDFRQVLPVVPQKTQTEAVAASLVSSALWPFFKRFRLTDNMRAREDLPFSDFLLSLGNGALQGSEVAQIQLPSQLVLPFDENADSLATLVNNVFPEIENVPFSEDIFTDRAILTPMNDDVDEINTSLIERYPGEEVVYKSFDMLLDDGCNIYPVEFLNTLCPGGMSPHKLVLKENCPVILLRNLAPSSGLCNGTRLLCKRFFPNMIECVITTGHHRGEYVFLPRINLRPSSSLQYPFQFQRKQFPIKLSFAMTINKSQGQTLNQVGLYLRRPCFSHGQLYVGLSRARRSTNVKVLAKPTAHQNSANSVKNIVSFSVLEKAGPLANKFFLGL